MEVLREIIHDSYSFDGQNRDPLKVENFEIDKKWDIQLFNARRAVQPLKEYQGTTIFFSTDRSKRFDYYCALRAEKKKDGKHVGPWRFFEKDEDTENKHHIDNLIIPSQDPKTVIVLDYHVFGLGGKNVKPLKLIETCSRWNNEFDAQIYICAYVDLLSDEHAKLLARFDDPVFQKIFEGLFVIPLFIRRLQKEMTLPNEVLKELSNCDKTNVIYIDRQSAGSCKNGDKRRLSPHDRIESIEKYIRTHLEVHSEDLHNMCLG